MLLSRCNDVTVLTIQRGAHRSRLLDDAMFEFPNPKCRQEEGLGAGEGAGGGHGMFAVMAVGTAAWASGFFAGFRFADGAGGGVMGNV